MYVLFFDLYHNFTNLTFSHKNKKFIAFELRFYIPHILTLHGDFNKYLWHEKVKKL